MDFRMRFLFAMAGLLLLLVQIPVVGEEECGKPHLRWKVGDSWAICDWASRIRKPPNQLGPDIEEYMVAPRYYRFVVLGDREMGGQLCFELSCTAYDGKTSQDLPRVGRYLTYYHKETGMLVRVINNSERGDGSSSYMRHKPRDPYIETTISRDHYLFYGGIPFMFPEWDRPEVVSRDLETTRWADLPKDVGRNRAETVSGRGWNRQVVSKCTDETGEFLEYRFQEIFQDQEDSGTENVIMKHEFVMEWRPGEPWWRECRRYEYGKQVRRTDLIRIGDVDIEPPPPPTQVPPEPVTVAEEAAQEMVKPAPGSPLGYIILGASIVSALSGALFIVIRRNRR